MTQEERQEHITGSVLPAVGNVLWYVYSNGNMDDFGNNRCFGVRPVVSMKSGVYAVSGDGSGSDPYILGKD